MGKIIVALIVLLAPLGVFGNEVTIQPGPGIGQDTYGSSYDPDENYGNLMTMHAANNVFAFLRFTQLDEYIGYEITSATLRVYVSCPTAGTRYFCRVLEPWDEDTLTWNNKPQHSHTDYVYKYIGLVEGTINIDVTWMVQNWVDEEWENFGWCINDVAKLVAFAPSKFPLVAFVTSNSTAPSSRPRLILEGPDLPPIGVQPTSLGKIKSLFTP